MINPASFLRCVGLILCLVGGANAGVWYCLDKFHAPIMAIFCIVIGCVCFMVGEIEKD